MIVVLTEQIHEELENFSESHPFDITQYYEED